MEQNTSDEQSSNRPVETIRVGKGVKATIWQNEGKSGKPFYKVELTTSFQKDGQWQNSKQFTRDELLHVARAATAAYDYLLEDLTLEETVG